MRVTRVGSGDVAELLRFKVLSDERVSAGALRSYLRDTRNIFFLAMEDGAGLGYLPGTALRQIRSNRLQMLLYEIGVTAPYRRRGVGRALITALLDYCRSRQFDEIFDLTDPGNLAAVRLYRSTGAKPETPADRMLVYRLAGDPPRPPRAAGRQSGGSERCPGRSSTNSCVRPQTPQNEIRKVRFLRIGPWHLAQTYRGSASGGRSGG